MKYRINFSWGSIEVRDMNDIQKYEYDVDFINYEEVVEAAKPVRYEIPKEVACWRIRAIISVMGLEPSVNTILESLEEPTKTIAKYAWYQGSTVERRSPTVLSIAQALTLSDSQIDQIFIEASNIVV